MCKTCTRPFGTLQEFWKADDMLQTEEEKKGKGAEGRKGWGQLE